MSQNKTSITSSTSKFLNGTMVLQNANRWLFLALDSCTTSQMFQKMHWIKKDWSHNLIWRNRFGRIHTCWRRNHESEESKSINSPTICVNIHFLDCDIICYFELIDLSTNNLWHISYTWQCILLVDVLHFLLHQNIAIS